MVHHKIPRTKLRGIFYCLFLRELLFVHHWGREWLAVEAPAACGGNREPEQAQRAQRTSPAQGAQADAVTASRRPAVRPAGQKQSSGRFLGRGRVPDAMHKKSLLLSASFFDCLGKAAVFCVHKLKEKMRPPSLGDRGTAYAAGPLCRCATSPCVAGRHPARGGVWAGGYRI